MSDIPSSQKMRHWLDGYLHGFTNQLYNWVPDVVFEGAFAQEMNTSDRPGELFMYGRFKLAEQLHEDRLLIGFCVWPDPNNAKCVNFTSDVCWEESGLVVHDQTVEGNGLAEFVWVILRADLNEITSDAVRFAHWLIEGPKGKESNAEVAARAVDIPIRSLLPQQRRRRVLRSRSADHQQ